MLVNAARRDREDRTQHEVAQLADTRGAGALDDDVEQVLHEADDRAVHRAQRKCPQQGGQVGEVHLDEGRDEHRDGKLNEHQDKGHRAEHGGNGKIVGRVLFHGYDSFPGKRPCKNVPKALFVSQKLFP